MASFDKYSVRCTLPRLQTKAKNLWGLRRASLRKEKSLLPRKCGMDLQSACGERRLWLHESYLDGRYKRFVCLLTLSTQSPPLTLSVPSHPPTQLDQFSIVKEPSTLCLKMETQSHSRIPLNSPTHTFPTRLQTFRDILDIHSLNWAIQHADS